MVGNQLDSGNITIKKPRKLNRKSVTLAKIATLKNKNKAWESFLTLADLQLGF